MLTIATSRRLKQFYFCDNFHEKINFIDNSSKDADLYFTRVQWQTYDSNKVKPNEVTILGNPRKYANRGILRCREGFCVDNRILPRPDFNNFCFATNDFCGIPYLILSPYGPRFGDNKTIKNETFNNKVFWSGSITHETRRDVLSFYNIIDDKRFDVSLFKEYITTLLNRPVSKNFKRYACCYDYIFSENAKITIDFIGKMENFQKDFNVICDKIGISRQQLPH